MHRVVNLVSVGIDPAQIAIYKEEIRQKLTEYNLHQSEVNDGHDEKENPTLGISVDFNCSTEANEFHNWLKQYITDRREYFQSVRTRVHDCFHAENLNMPCRLGDVWELS